MFFKKKKSQLSRCSKCNHKVSKSARTCPSCGHPIGIISWLTESKILLLVTSLVGINGLWFVDLVTGHHPSQEQKQVKARTTRKGRVGRRSKIRIGRLRKKKKFVICPICAGRGKVRCSKCRTSSTPGFIKCTRCNGTGKCQKCKGKGRISRYDPITKRSHSRVCPKCKGTGKCRFCKGRGMVKCKNCSHGYVTCFRCRGKGKIRVR